MSHLPIPPREACTLLQGVLCFLLLGLFFAPRGLSGQVIPDTIPPPDTIQMVAEPDDTLGMEPPVPDSINPADTLPAVRLQELARPTPEGWKTGVWQWDRDEILGSRAITLAELLGEAPGVVLVRGGDYGNPVGVSAFGAGGGRVRVFRDGLEILPLEGSVTDLSRIGLAGLRSVRLVRAVGELRIELESILTEGGRPYSLVEAGTGDLNTNLFRGTFSHPRAGGGAVALGMDRVDTQGTQGQDRGSNSGGWIRYAKPLWGRGVVVLDWGSKSADRGDTYSPGKASRSDWSLRTRWNLLPGLVGDLYHASSSLRTEKPDTFEFSSDKRTQTGIILSFATDRVRTIANLRKLSGEGVPGTAAHLEVEGDAGRYAGLSGEVDWESWEDRSISRYRIRGWTSPLPGLSLFAETGSGEWGLPYLPPNPVPPSESEEEEEITGEADSAPSVLPGPRFAEHGGVRYGAEYQWRGLTLSGARFKAESDSLFILGLPTDRHGVTAPGGSRSGFEVATRLPLYPSGLALVGSLQWWDQEEDIWAAPEDSLSDPGLRPAEEIPWRYVPRRSYEASFSFHDTFYPTGNLEVWFDLGVRGRDPMVVPLEEEAQVGGESALVPSMVPFYQSWFVRLQVRIVTVRAFIMWENVTVRQGNQDLPGRLLPFTRSLYGVRWTMWN